MADKRPARQRQDDQRPAGSQLQEREQPSSGAASRSPSRSPSPSPELAEDPPQPAGFSETVPGGRYIVDGQVVDAEGRPRP